MLSKLKWLFWVGVLLLFVPFVGVPKEWRNALTIIIAIMVIYIVFAIKSDYKKLRSISKVETEMEHQ